MKLSVKRALLISGAVAAATLAAPTAANAAVSNCTKWIDNNHGFVSCTTTNGSQYRAHVKCAKISDPTQYFWANGQWVPPGTSSSAGCVSGTEVAEIVVQKR